MFLHTKYQDSMPCRLRQDICFMFSLYEPMKNMLPQGQGHFLAQGHYLNKRGRSPQGDATCQISRLKALCFQII